MPSLVRYAGPALLAAVAANMAFHADHADPPAIRVTWLGHAAFEVVSPGGTRLLIDPWLVENPSAPAVYKDTTRWARPEARPAAILVTHPHADHGADVPLLARVSGAKVVATGDHIEAMGIPEWQYLSINIGGVQRVGDVEIHAVPAMHSSTPGRALGYVLRFADGRTLYHTGDTWVFGDMALIERFFHPAVILIAAGGGRAGEDPEAAAFAVRTYFHPRAIVPMHYGALPAPFATEAEVRAAFENDPRLHLLVPGQERSF
ncbi:MAG TPA: MBL fold metallo-hydrolase [Gemmatimonadales bacterium]|nr:MBL fold metallo-hydrolase [Gemmatimonadales bacterium]